MEVTGCKNSDIDPCQDKSAAFNLKMIAIASILLASVAGVAIPLVGKHRHVLRPDGSLFALAKAFAAGVILATGFVHMLDAGSDALSDPSLPELPWSIFPFSGFFAMLAALLTLLVDFLGTQYYENKQVLAHENDEQSRVGLMEPSIETGLLAGDGNDAAGRVFREEEDGAMHIVGLHGHGVSHGVGDGEEDSTIRHVVISQVLELGIVSHSVIIGLSLGVSQSPCIIRPLIAALSFHQFFEGFALGGCISQARFKTFSAALMACFFSVTTPAGIAVGTAVASIYNPDSPGALVTEGILDSLSAGILIYMALVDLIAADLLSKKMSCNFRLQVTSYLMLFLGAGLMAALAIWA